MPRIEDIVGQEHIVSYYRDALNRSQLSHAYIINGERLAGKEFITKVIVMSIMCREGDDPCGICESCRQLESGSHPDVTWISHDKPSTISVDDIRKQVNDTLLIKPYVGPKKIYIIPDGEKMTPQAQNALLKTIEEPPLGTMFFILTSNSDRLLSTIRSRCVEFNMRAVSAEAIQKYLMEQLYIPDYKAITCAAFSRGNVGKAKLLATTEDFDKVKDEAVLLIKNIKNMDLYEVVQAVKNIREYHLDIDYYLDILSIWYRDVLLFKATNDANGLIFKQEIQHIRNMATQSDYEGLEKIIEAIDKVKARISAGVSVELALELLMIVIQEN